MYVRTVCPSNQSAKVDKRRHMDVFVREVFVFGGICLLLLSSGAVYSQCELSN